MQNLFYAAGLGSGSAPMAAALYWVMKDGVGQLGGVLFASLVSARFDAEARSYRMLAALLLDASTFLELSATLMPQYFLPIASVANCGKNISFLAASASRAAIHQSFATKDNLADVTAKTGSQTIAMSTIGTGLGIGVGALAGGEWIKVAIGVIALNAVHLCFNYISLKHVILRTLNQQRLGLLLDGAVALDVDSRVPLKLANPLMSPSEVAEVQPILPLEWAGLRGQARLFADRESRIGARVEILLHEDADSRDVIRAYLQGYVTCHLLHENGVQRVSGWSERFRPAKTPKAFLTRPEGCKLKTVAHEALSRAVQAESQSGVGGTRATCSWTAWQCDIVWTDTRRPDDDDNATHPISAVSRAVYVASTQTLPSAAWSTRARRLAHKTRIRDYRELGPPQKSFRRSLPAFDGRGGVHDGLVGRPLADGAELAVFSLFHLLQHLRDGQCRTAQRVQKRAAKALVDVVALHEAPPHGLNAGQDWRATHMYAHKHPAQQPRGAGAHIAHVRHLCHAAEGARDAARTQVLKTPRQAGVQTATLRVRPSALGLILQLHIRLLRRVAFVVHLSSTRRGDLHLTSTSRAFLRRCSQRGDSSVNIFDSIRQKTWDRQRTEQQSRYYFKI
eukprot:scaffold964_cov261-Pinguiococcus_pyrenoidosus.AAC.6